MLSRRIQELRASLGWSQVELAKRLQISKQTVSNWENDNIQPSEDMLIRIARLFGVTTDYLLTGEQEQEPPVRMVPEEERKAIAQSGDEKVKKQFDYRNGVSRIVGILEETN